MDVVGGSPSLLAGMPRRWPLSTTAPGCLCSG